MEEATGNYQFSIAENKNPEGLSSLARTPITEAITLS